MSFPNPIRYDPLFWLALGALVSGVVLLFISENRLFISETEPRAKIKQEFGTEVAYPADSEKNVTTNMWIKRLDYLGKTLIIVAWFIALIVFGI